MVAHAVAPESDSAALAALAAHEATPHGGGGGGGTPSAHALTHAVGGTDVLSPADIGAATAAALVTETTTRSGADILLTTAVGAKASIAAVDAAIIDAKARANHTGVQTSATISDFTEAVQDAVAALLGAGSNLTLTYNDALDTLTVSATDTTDPEAVRDAIGIALVGVGAIGVTINDVADTITINTTATANATDAQLRDRVLHTGVQPIATISGLQAALDVLVVGPVGAVSGNLATFSGTTGKLVQDAGVSPSSLSLAGDTTGTLGGATVAKVRGKTVPTPGAAEDGKGWYYDHATGGFIFGISPQVQTTLAQYDLDLMLGGVSAPLAPWLNVASSTFSAGRAYYARFVVSRAMTITQMSFVVTTLDAVDNAVHVGIADGTCNRIVTSGAVTGKLTSTGGKTVAIASTVLAPRTVYYAVFLAPVLSAGTALVFGNMGNASMWGIFGTSPPSRLGGYLDGQSAIPSTAALTAPVAAAGVPWTAVRE